MGIARSTAEAPLGTLLRWRLSFSDHLLVFFLQLKNNAISELAITGESREEAGSRLLAGGRGKHLVLVFYYSNDEYNLAFTRFCLTLLLCFYVQMPL